METDCEDDILPLVFLIVFVGAYHQYRAMQLEGRRWMRPWISRRGHYGAYHSLIQELASQDRKGLKNFLRMDLESFNTILEIIKPQITHQDTHMRSAIKAEERLALTLRYLATGETYQSLEYLYRIPKATISSIIPETCTAIINSMKDLYLKTPTSQQEWLRVAAEFEERWNFPNCLGAMDGKHVAIRCPQNSGSTFYNYKNFFSIILLAIVDADYKFLYVDVGSNGRMNDSGVFSNSRISHLLEGNGLNMPPPRPLPGRINEVPYVLVGDDAFPLRECLLKPYPNRQLDNEKRVFNYRLSRARRLSENVFGIMTNRFGMLSRTILLEPERATTVVLAACVLHNFLRSNASTRNNYAPDENLSNDASQSSEILRGLNMQRGNRSSNSAQCIRDEFCDYFCTNGQVPWQWDLT